MTKIEKYEITDRAQWLEWRKKDVTASDVASCLGFSPWKSALRLWMEKTGAISDIAETDLMRRGRWLESSVLAAYQDEQYAGVVIPAGTTYWRVPAWRIGCTPDAYVDDPLRGKGVLQAKVVSRSAFQRWDEGEAPIYYVLQTLTEMMVTDLAYGVLAVLVIEEHGVELECFPIERHPAAEKAIKEGVKRFWADARAGRMPEADLARDKNLLAQVMPPKRRTTVELAHENIEALIEEREIIRKLRRDYKARQDEIDTILIREMSTAEVGRAGPFEVTYSLRHVEEHTVAASTSPMLRVKRKERR